MFPSKHIEEEDYRLPLRSYDLIADLDRLIPHRCPLPGMSLEEIHRYAGARQLLDELVEMKREDEEEATLATAPGK